MPEIKESTRQDIFKKIINFIQTKLAPEKARLLIPLVPQYYGTIPLEDFAARSIEDLVGIMVGHLKLMQHRKPKECKLHIYNPNLETHGWQSTHTIIELSYDDMPFLVDSMNMEINRLGFTIHLVVSCGGVCVVRDAKGNLVEILSRSNEKDPTKKNDLNQEALVHLEIDRETDEKLLKTLEENLLRVIHDVTLVVEDWQKMRDQLFLAIEELEQLKTAKTSIDTQEIEESQTFLRWLVNDRFTFLGYRAYEVVGKDEKLALKLIPGTGLGVLRDESKSKVVRYFNDLPPKARELVLSPKTILIISQTNTEATVHRKSRFTIYIGIKRFSNEGKLIGEHRFIGLYTSEAYNSDPQFIPVLREKVEKVLSRSGLPRSGHNARALRNILATIPRDDLFQADIEELYTLSMGILNLQDRRHIKLFVRKDAYGRYFSCLVYVPRENFNTELLYKMRDILLRAFGGKDITFATQFSESILARIHFVVYVDAKKPLSYDTKEIEQELIEVGRLWYDDLRDNLIEHFGEEKGTELYHHYSHAFPAGYRENFTARETVYDIEHIEKLKSPHELGMSFYHSLSGQSDTLRFKLYHLDTTVPLSDALPMLENMGLRVIGEQPYQIFIPNEKTVWINDFITEYKLGTEVNFEENKNLFQEDFYRIWLGEVENDGFNRLVLKAQLNWRQVSMFRAYAKYLRQTGFTFSQQYTEETLVANPTVVNLLLELFELRFNPEKQQENTAENLDRLLKAISRELDLVSNIDQDRILRRYKEVIMATLRTNFYHKEDENIHHSYISFKLDPTRVPELPLPLPLYEIFVYSPRFEGVHLRSGKVARGGIRWSDRKEDFRTEVLGLMKAQQVKNAIIVPAGAKGGFVPKWLPVDGSREAIMEEGIACYKNFIRGLLDITDNLKGNEVIHPVDTVIYDGNDPYLVVAADKGTASFSDIANSISADYHFWLGDAFASGGSTGYDHKKMGITSRGAWESVKQHFQRIRLDINQPFTVVGIGDMSGDVFGNGMLRSDRIKLVAAFNDKHIFLDPNPDPKESFQERRRLFALPRSTWQDYNPELISKGGGVFNRSAKSIQLSPQIQTVLGIQKNNIEPNELIRAILKAPVDLIWNGGIGTYVKSSQERNFEVGDHANDSLRVNGNELRAKVVGEGGNLGWTQLGRIEYELFANGNINTDFIDNSAGVDCSDHEVNIKILLNEVIHAGEMTEKQRNALLSSMTEEVADLVLKDNYRQVRTITRAVSQSLDYLSLYINYMADQGRAGKINRQLEFLPDANTLMERKANGKALTRPEIAVLIEYSKIILKEEILKSNLIHDRYMSKFIESAFPHVLVEKFQPEMEKHRLRPELIATQLSNALVNDMGPVFVYQMQDEMSAPVPAIVQAYVIMRNIFDIPWLLAAIDKLDDETPIDERSGRILEMTLEAVRLTRRGVRWLLRNQRPPYDIESIINRFSEPVNSLYRQLPDLLIGTERENFEARIQNLISTNVPTEIAVRVTSARYIYSALNIIQVVTEQKANIDEVAKIYFILADRLDLVWFREQINAYPVDNHWAVLARSAFKDELDEQQRALTISVLSHKDEGMNVEESIELWLKEHELLLQRWQAVLTQMRSANVVDAAILTVAIQELSELAHNSIH